MTLEEEAALSYYQTVEKLNEKENLFLVRNLSDSHFYVRKELSSYNAEVYRQLKRNPVRNTPKIYEAIEDNHTLIVIEEYIPGDTLEDILHKNGPFSEEAAADIIRQLCVIVNGLHTLSPPVIHRDIKPSNIILTSDHIVKLLDMNAAKQYDHTEDRDTKLIGTAGYAAPEQYGFAASTPQTDIYALGMLLNTLLSGSVSAKYQRSSAISAIIQKATQIDYNKRYHSVMDLYRALESGGYSSKNLNLLPGFRGNNTFVKMLSFLGYFLLTYCGLFVEVEGADTPALLWTNRIIFLLMFYSLILFSGNYRNIHKKLNITSMPNRYLRILSIVVIDFVIMSVSMFVLAALETFLR